MAVAAETLNYQNQTAETISRRTDDIIFNVKYLSGNIIDKTQGTFLPGAEYDVFEQNVTEIAEADVHKLGARVYQHFDRQLGQYVSLGVGTVDNAQRGLAALDTTDGANHFELYRRAEEVAEEETILQPTVSEAMRAGVAKISISPAPTHHEADPDVAASFGYDDRTMFRLQRLTPDGQTKTMQSFSVFNIPAKAWAGYLGKRYGVEIEQTALAVMQFCNQVILGKGSTPQILQEFIGGVMDYVNEEDKVSLERQLEGFLQDQAELEKQVAYYANEKLILQRELALCLNGWARPAVANMMHDAFDRLNPNDRQLLAERYSGGQLYVDDYVAELAIKMKTVMTDNRAGLATLNEFTVKRMASRIGLEATLELAAREQAIQQMPLMNEFMVRRSEQQIAESGAGCGGACSVSVVGLFSSEAKAALDAGLSGTLYSSRELDKSSKCSCSKTGKKAKVIADGSNVFCVTCTEFKVNGSRGRLKPTQQSLKS